MVPIETVGFGVIRMKLRNAVPPGLCFCHKESAARILIILCESFQ